MWALLNLKCEMDLSRNPTNNGTESRSGWTKIQPMYENVHPNFALVLLFVHSEVECGKGLLDHILGLSVKCVFRSPCWCTNALHQHGERIRSSKFSFSKTRVKRNSLARTFAWLYIMQRVLIKLALKSSKQLRK